jgi:hypothetical protein
VPGDSSNHSLCRQSNRGLAGLEALGKVARKQLRALASGICLTTFMMTYYCGQHASLRPAIINYSAYCGACQLICKVMLKEGQDCFIVQASHFQVGIHRQSFPILQLLGRENQAKAWKLKLFFEICVSSPSKRVTYEAKKRSYETICTSAENLRYHYLCHWGNG